MGQEHLKWFTAARLGMFIHWGLYAIPARGEWVKHAESLSDEAYAVYFDTFAPEDYDPTDWAQLARRAGMRYAVMTAKHHDGFCLFDSQYTDYKATRTPAGRDLIAEYVRAFREAGLKVGLYYSLLDWHHPAYPVAGDPFHPRRNDPAYRDHHGDLAVYQEYLHNQVRELLTNYGRIDVMWFDFSYDHMTGDAWRAGELVRMVRRLQPDIIIDNRLGGNLKSSTPEEYAGDFFSPEQYIPPEGIVDNAGQPLPWEACITLNDHWGYDAGDHHWKSARTVVRLLVECVSKGGNLLLNVGPNARGAIPSPCRQILETVGEWLRLNGRSIYGCGPAAWPKPQWGWFTQNGARLYAHIEERGVGVINLRGLEGKIRYARRLSDGAEVKVERPWTVTDCPHDAFLKLPPAAPGEETMDAVIELTLHSSVSETTDMVTAAGP